MTNSVDPTTIGAFVTIILAFLGTAKIMLNQATKEREADRGERLELSKAIVAMSESGNAQAVATKEGFDNLVRETKQGNEQSEKRNGHLAELVVKAGENTLEAIQTVKEQHIEHQEVKQAVLKRAIIKKTEE